MNIWAVSTFLGTFNNIAMDILTLALACTFVFIFPDYIPRSGLTGSYGNSVFNIARLFAKASIPLYIPTSTVGMVNFFFKKTVCIYLQF